MRAFLFAGCLAVAPALGLLGCSSGGGPDPEPASSGVGPLGPATSLRGILYCEKSHRLTLDWDNGNFELWDTEHGRRLGDVQRLLCPVGWCVASPNEATILTGDGTFWSEADRAPPRLNAPAVGKPAPMPTIRSEADRATLKVGFIPMVSIWDAKSGVRKHSIQVGKAETDPLWTCEWYARWLDNTRVLLVRLWRENPVRTASWIQLSIVDTAAGKVVKDSESFHFAGEHVILSRDRKMALVKDDNYMRRGKACIRNSGARTHVIDLETLKVLSAWREPPDLSDEEEGIAHIAQWCPDGKTVLTAKWGHSYGVRLWDARSGRLLHTFTGHTDNVLDAALTTAGDKLMTASEDHSVRVWDIRTATVETVLSGHEAGLNKVVVLPGDKLAVSAAEEPVAKVWDLTAGKLKFDLPDHDSAVREVEVASDTVVRTVTLRGTATTWDCSTGERLQFTPKPPDYPKRFGVCELVEEKGTLHMRVSNQTPTVKE
jgi:WD40 repeat protein